MKLFNKILVANRGEIAVRIIQSARKLGIRTIAIYSAVDSESAHSGIADEAFCIGQQELSETYLNIEKIIEIARSAYCDAIHPGYGFLAENPLFAEACEKNGIVFIGPHPTAIRLMGNKIESRAFVKSLDVPMTEGITGSTEFLLQNAPSMSFPLLVKAAAGGGGKGMRIVVDPADLENILESTSREAKSYFGDPTVYIEKYIEQPRHIEFQVIGDNFGNLVHLFERECTIQRRYQKIIEESPSPTMTPDLRNKMGEAALRIAREINYNSVGTIEFLVDSQLNFYFLEMNTRIQVEHPVTEMVTGIDLVEEQILVAAGNPLRLRQEELLQTGHAIECRIYAEDPENNFLPSPGEMTLYLPPHGENIRIDSSIEHAGTILSFFDPMICKMIVWGECREIATKRCISAMQNFVIQGIHTNIEYMLGVLNHRAFQENDLSTRFCDEHTGKILNQIRQSKTDLSVPLIAFALYSLRCTNFDKKQNTWDYIGYWRNRMQLEFKVPDERHAIIIENQQEHNYQIRYKEIVFSVNIIDVNANRININIDGTSHIAAISFDKKGLAWISLDGGIYQMMRLDMLNMKQDFSSHVQGDGISNLFSPMPGKVTKVHVKAGDRVKRGTVLLVVEAMKMENNILAENDAIIEHIVVNEGDMVDSDTQLVYLNLIE
ncbi:MAG: biotin carboxylase N-terminal domain-containing protein [Bacteroidales bacterium]